MQTNTYRKNTHGSYIIVILTAITIVATVFAGLFLFQVFKPVQTSADGGKTLGRNSESRDSSVSLLPYHWINSDHITVRYQNLPATRLFRDASASTSAATQFLAAHPGASIKLCVNAQAFTDGASLTISSPSLSGARITSLRTTFHTICVRQSISTSVGTSESPDNWNTIQIKAHDSTILIRSISLTVS